jgi:hypothetical protein
VQSSAAKQLRAPHGGGGGNALRPRCLCGSTGHERLHFDAGAGGAHDGIDRLLGVARLHAHLEQYLRNKAHIQLRPAIPLGMPHLAAKALGFNRSHTQNTQLGELGFDSVQFGRLDDSLNHLHGDRSLAAVP